MIKATHGTVELKWDPASRVAAMRFEDNTRSSGEDATILVSALTEWLGSDPERRPFALLADAARLDAMDAGWRSTWGKFFREHRDHAWIAVFHMGPLIRIGAEMFRLGTGVRLKGFAEEDDARAWLRKNGIPV